MFESARQRSISIRVRFVTIMQQYSGQRELVMHLPTDPQVAIDVLIKRFQIPWTGTLEKSVRIFINKELLETFRKSGQPLKEGDRITFIPLSGGG